MDNKKFYELGLYEKSMPNTLSFREKLETVKATGFDFLEISIDETDEKLARLEWTKEERLVRNWSSNPFNVLKWPS